MDDNDMRRTMLTQTGQQQGERHSDLLGQGEVGGDGAPLLQRSERLTEVGSGLLLDPPQQRVVGGWRVKERSSQRLGEDLVIRARTGQFYWRLLRGGKYERGHNDLRLRYDGNAATLREISFQEK